MLLSIEGVFSLGASSRIQCPHSVSFKLEELLQQLRGAMFCPLELVSLHIEDLVQVGREPYRSLESRINLLENFSRLSYLRFFVRVKGMR